MDKSGHRAAIHNLDPISKMVAPSDVSELRRVLGLMVQHKDSIKSWAYDARPLHVLTRKGENVIGPLSAMLLSSACVTRA